jgi:hypothetical protein
LPFLVGSGLIRCGRQFALIVAPVPRHSSFGPTYGFIVQFDHEFFEDDRLAAEIWNCLISSIAPRVALNVTTLGGRLIGPPLVALSGGCWEWRSKDLLDFGEGQFDFRFRALFQGGVEWIALSHDFSYGGNAVCLRDLRKAGNFQPAL